MGRAVKRVDSDLIVKIESNIGDLIPKIVEAGKLAAALQEKLDEINSFEVEITAIGPEGEKP
jgi:hypothetical protein